MQKITILAASVLGLLILSGCNEQAITLEPSGVTQEGKIPLESQAPSATATVSPDAVSQPTSIDYCLACHADQRQLIENYDPEKDISDQLPGLEWAGDLPDLEMWEKVWVDAENFIPTVHGRFPCTSCHGGQQSPEKEIAHTDLNLNPSQGPQVVCGECHPDIAHTFELSLHSTVNGLWTAIEQRSASSSRNTLERMFSDNCASCHNTCGDCHVSQPRSVGGGLYEGHLFQRTPPADRSCNACHGSRVGDEFLGSRSGSPADVHFRQAGMSCSNCHTGEELHGAPANCADCHPGPENAVLPLPQHRYDGVQAPKCETCHTTVSTGSDGLVMHQMHGANLSCQVCHSVSYRNCEGCHVGINEVSEIAKHELDGISNQFLIGRNPKQTYERPYRFVLLRHVPIARDSFDAYGKNLLTNFDKIETWKYITPHNIQRRTPQTEGCNSCHGNLDLFLTADKVKPDELEANRKVIVETIPPPITSAEQLP